MFSDATVNYFRDAAIMYPDAVEGKSNYSLVVDTFRAAGVHVEHGMSYMSEEDAFNTYSRGLRSGSVAAGKPARKQQIQERCSFALLAFQAAGVPVSDGLLPAIRQVPCPLPPPSSFAE